MSTLIKRNGTWYKVKDTVTSLEYYRSVPVYTGKRWIDGRPIYNLAIHVDNVPNESSQVVFDTGLGENVKDCLRLEAVLQNVDTHGQTYIESSGTPLGYDSRFNWIWFRKKSTIDKPGTIFAYAALGYSKSNAPDSKIIIQMEFTLSTDTADTFMFDAKAIKRAGVFKKSKGTLIKHNGMWVNVYQYKELYQFKLNEEVYTGSHWLDGKPIYAKVIKGKTSTNTYPNITNVNTYPASIASNFKDMIDIWGIMQNADHPAGVESVMQITGEKKAGINNSSLCWYNITSDNVYIRGAGNFSDSDTYVILFYTKQTDTNKPITNVRDTCSAEEIFTGRYWLNGKKIYRKCYNTLFSGGTASATGINSIPTGLPANTIKNMIRCRSIANRCDNNDVFILACGGLDHSTATNPDKYCNVWYNSQSNVLNSNGLKYYANKQQMITIEYTKE